MNTPFARKVAYGAAIAALLYPLFMLGQPASKGRESRGGQLAQLRDEYGLSQISLGEIDPASESLRLASLGMRGVAANHLWIKAQEFKKKENWAALSATLNQITKLQPNFLEVWEFQSHNLSYNVSAEFDDYRYRYHWVKKGIDFLVKGVHYNRDEPILFHSLGKYTGQKIGVADEKLLFRELFRDDTDWHTLLAEDIPNITGPEVKGTTGQPDNWLTARLWYLKGEAAVDQGNKVLRGSSPLIFHSDRPKQRINFAQAIQEEGFFDQATEAWRDGGEEWREDFGSRTLPSSWGVSFQLREKEEVMRSAIALREELDELLPGMREQIEQEKFETLTDVEKRSYKATEEEQETWRRDTPEAVVYWDAQAKMKISDMDLAARAPENVRAKARRLAERVEEQLVLAQYISRYRGIINFDYWSMRAEAEQTKMVAEARTKLFTAGEKLQEADLEGAQADYEDAWDLWDEIFTRWPALQSKDSMVDLAPALAKYRRVLNHQNKPDIAPDFKLAWLLDAEELAAIEANYKKRQVENAAQGKVDDPAEPGDNPDPAEPKEPAEPTEEPVEPTEPKPSAQPATDNEALLPPVESTPKQEGKSEAKEGPLPPLEAPAKQADTVSFVPFSMTMLLTGFLYVDGGDDELEPPIESVKPADEPAPATVEPADVEPAAEKTSEESEESTADQGQEPAASPSDLTPEQLKLMSKQEPQPAPVESGAAADEATASESAPLNAAGCVEVDECCPDSCPPPRRRCRRPFLQLLQRMFSRCR